MRALLFRDRTWLVLSVIMALVIYALGVGLTLNQPEWALPLIDSAAYHQQAMDWAQGQGVSRQPYWQPPFYVWWVGSMYALFGVDVALVRFLQGLFQGVSVCFTFLLARFWLSPRKAFLAALALALCGPFLWYSSQLMPVGLFMALSLPALYLTLREVGQKSWGLGILAGLLWGLSVLTLPTVLIPLGLLFAGLFLTRFWSPPDGEGAWKQGVIMVACIGLVMAPVALRNFGYAQEGALISTNSGINFYIGNNGRTDVTLRTRPGIDWERLERLPYLSGAVTPVQADRFFWKRGWEWIKRRPGAAVRNFARKAREVFVAREIPRNLDYYTAASGSVFWKTLAWRWGSFYWPGAIILPLAIWGMGALLATRGRGRLVGLYAVGFVLVCILFFPTGRYRAPLWPLAMIGALWALQVLGTWIRERRWARLGWGGSLLAGCILLVNLPVVLPTDKVNYRADLDVALGAAFEKRGELDRAEAYYRRALKEDPRFADAWYNLGNVQRTRGQVLEALDSYTQALKQRPDHDKALGNRGYLYYGKGQKGEALSDLRQAVEANPLNPVVRHNLGVVLNALGYTTDAREQFQKEQEIRQFFAGFQ